MANITDKRADFLLGFISPTPGVIDFVEQRLKVKGLQSLTELKHFESFYQTQMKNFYKNVFAGKEDSLPPSSLVGLALNEARQIDLKKAQMNNLLSTVCFDQDNNILVKYTVDQSESLEDWATKNSLDPENIKSMLDSYFLEFFDEKGLQIVDGKLFQLNSNQLITEDGFRSLLADAKGLKDKLNHAGISKAIDINTENLGASIENLVKNLNI